MTQKRLVLYEEHFYEMLSYLVSSAYLMAQGEEFEQYFPSLRLIDGANRLTRFALESGANDDQGWLSGFLQENMEGLALLGSDNQAFEKFLMEATHSLAKEIKRRDAA